MRSTSGTRRPPSTLLLALILVACSASPSDPAGSPSGGAVAQPSPTAAATGGAATLSQSVVLGARLDRLVVGMAFPPSEPSPLLALSNATVFPDITRFVYSGLFRLDASLAPAPDLAAEPCAIDSAGLRITCRLREATFHDGTPVTAHDAAYTYRLGLSRVCPFLNSDVCMIDSIQEVTAVDDRTLELRLKRPDPTVLSLLLPGAYIQSRRQIEADVAPFLAAAPTLDGAAYADLADRIDAALAPGTSASAQECAALADDVDALIENAGLGADLRGYFVLPGSGPSAAPDLCGYAGSRSMALREIVDALELEGIDRIARVFGQLSLNRHPIGSGPWKVASVGPPDGVTLVAHENSHHGPPATPTIEVRVFAGVPAAVEAMRAGELNWLWLFSAAAASELKDEPAIDFVEYPGSVWFFLAYNHRPGRLFAERDLRRALERCIDKPATVETATRGTGIPIYSPIPPASWAYQGSLAPPRRDVAAARALIEGLGWTVGSDGVYVRDGRRLSTEVLVREDDTDRVRFVDLVAAQVRDCGIELRVTPADPQTVLGPVFEYPHIAPGRTEPFDALFFGWISGPDPHTRLFHSREISSEEQPDAINALGFSHPRVDELLDAGTATYDQRERARIYRDLQLVLAEEQPVLFGWSPRVHEAISSGIRLTEGEIDRASQRWWWQLERLVIHEVR